MGRHLALVLLIACKGGDKDDSITPLDETDAHTDVDTDVDTDGDTDTDTGPVANDVCAPLPAPTGPTVDVSPGVNSLSQAVAAAAPGTTLLLADGTYSARVTIPIDKALTIRSASGDREAVIIDGERVVDSGNLFVISASDVTIAHVTVEHSWEDLVHVQPDGAPITGVRLHDVHLRDPGRQAVYIGTDGAGNYADDGEVTCSNIELTQDGRTDIRGSCDTGGIDAYGARGWEVRDNRIYGFWCPFGQSRPGIRFFRGARDTLITRNDVGDVTSGIVLGETRDLETRTYADNPCSGLVQSIDGVITNNLVWAHDDDIVASNAGIEVGILAESSCNVRIVHNSVYAAVEPNVGSIEHRYETTTGVVANNLASHAIRRLDDSLLISESNHEGATIDTWYYRAGGDFHTAPAATWAIDQGSTEYTLPDDFDATERTDGLPDIGADEL